MSDSLEAGKQTCEMWARLGQQIADAIPDIVIGGEPMKAVQWACCAEACFWKATGEADTHDVKDVLQWLAAKATGREDRETG